MTKKAKQTNKQKKESNSMFITATTICVGPQPLNSLFLAYCTSLHSTITLFVHHECKKHYCVVT